MDEFAQTRAPDDLFDDEFTPIDEPLVQEFVQPIPHKSQRGRHDRPRGQGRGRPNHQQQQHHQKPPAAQPPASTPTDPPVTTANNDTAAITADTPAEPEPTAPKPSTAVRGDRSATGGNAKPKLTEEELSARLAAAKLNNARREEAHRLAEADEASFQQREAQASQRRQEEGRARRLMDQEREKNRLRKLGAHGGREWDEGKDDQPVHDPRSSQYQRGAHGGAAGYPGHRGRNVEMQPTDGGDFRGGGYGGRGGRGSRGGRGRGRGGRGGRGGFDDRRFDVEILQQPRAPNDFPALPPAERPKTDGASQASQPQSQQQSTVEVPSFQPPPAGSGQSWADEVNAKAPSAGW
ncbi:MAG: hypothetical protein LQ348_001441 [Seirophora lacunosa]|nr:MAG: hypothetical protein LQ348_001441 [Seirophora lacunosa]